MSDFPENLPETGEEITEEESTVFSAPVSHKKTAPEKKKRLLPKVLAAFLVLAVLAGGTFAVFKLIPEKKKDSDENGEAQTASVPEAMTVLEEDADTLKKVKVTNENAVFTLYSETAKSDGDSEEKTVNWYVEGYPKEAVNTYSLSSIAKSAAKVTALRTVDKTPEQCGLDKPVATVDVVKGDGSTYSILIGGDSPDNSGVYVKISTGKEIYLSDTLEKSDFIFDDLSFANTDAIPGMDLGDVSSDYKTDEGTLSTFDQLTLSGAYFPETLVLAPNQNEELSQFAAFVTKTPTERVADKVDDIITLFSSGVTVSGAYSFDTSAAALKQFGLDAPDLKAEMVLDKKKITYSFKKQEDGGYAVWYDGAILIKKVEESNLSFINYRLKDYYATWVCIESINDLSAFTVKTKDETYAFSIAYDSENEDDPYEILYGGKKLTSQNFQDFYQECISLACIDFTVDEVTGEPDVSIVFTYSDSSRAATTVEFRKISETRYQYSIDGTPMGKVSSTSLSPILRDAAKVAKDESVK